jgi:hypothetical protein
MHASLSDPEPMTNPAPGADGVIELRKSGGPEWI